MLKILRDLVAAIKEIRDHRTRNARIAGRNAMEVKAFRSEHVVVTVRADGHRHKIFQIFFGGDGSIYVTFPYFKHTNGLLAVVTVTGPPGSSQTVDLADSGKVASHLVKYSHHPSGRAHFSQHGRVRTEIKRQSVPLNSQHGHIFTLLAQNLRSFTPVNSGKETSTSSKRTTLTFDMQDPFPKAFRIVGRRYGLEDLEAEPRPAVTGPKVQTVDADGIVRPAFIVASPTDGAKHVLLLTCTPEKPISPTNDALLFYGGFDSPGVTFDKTKSSSFLACMYPAHDF
jgi:hypothetical protein